MDELYKYFFHFNIYTKEWNAFKRENAGKYLNDYNDPDILRAEDINTIIKYITSGQAKK